MKVVDTFVYIGHEYSGTIVPWMMKYLYGFRKQITLGPLGLISGLNMVWWGEQKLLCIMRMCLRRSFTHLRHILYTDIM